MKHLEKRSRKKPMWILYIVAILALGLAIWAGASLLFDNDKADSPSLDGDKTPEIEAPGGEVPPPDSDKPADSSVELDAKRTELLDEVQLLARGYFYDEAIEKLSAAGELKNEQTDARLAEVQSLKSSLVKYEGQVYHVFFHSLILYPELAFDNKGHPAEGYNLWMTTRDEFNAMLPEMLKRDFILYDIAQLVEIDANGKAVQKDIYLPPGKKPLVISIDDVNYYDYMKPDGFADKLVINDKGDVVTRVIAPDGTVSDCYDGDVMPILDGFVKEYPEFSYRGAKGIVATTGYAGAFGYRITDLELYSKEEGDKMLADVQAIAKRLRETGWQIANHSYTHNGYFRDGTVTMKELEHDVTRWKTLIEPYVGKTPIFISPFGVHFKADDPRYSYIVEQGFYIYCPVSSGMNTSYRSGSMVQDRLNLDGFTMIKHPDRVSAFFDAAVVLDKARPPLK